MVTSRRRVALLLVARFPYRDVSPHGDERWSVGHRLHHTSTRNLEALIEGDVGDVVRLQVRPHTFGVDGMTKDGEVHRSKTSQTLLVVGKEETEERTIVE